MRIGIMFGGKSTESEVSIKSARSVFNAIDRKKYEVSLILIDKKGQWHLNEDSKSFPDKVGTGHDLSDKVFKNIAVVPGKNKKQIIYISDSLPVKQIDVIFPILHGAFGEDGTVQGLLKLINIPFVGAGVLGSAVGMDKDAMKRLLRDAGIPIAKFIVFENQSNANFNEVSKLLGTPVFVKPANAGSSVGINKASNKKQFDEAVKDAFKYDTKIIIEENIEGREIECSVLGNENPAASIPGEIVPQQEFYSYKAKYLDKKGAVLKIPADLPTNIVKEVQRIAIKTYKLLCCEGMARVDCFLVNNKKILVNEINTIPGFTSISMYPKLWEASGLSYSKLIDKLIQLALERFKKENKLQTSYF
ncbi:MAG: D-alanine--D-alanine ligase [bacterium]|nr:D-alanine--D-alanine ligase [bacterium]